MPNYNINNDIIVNDQLRKAIDASDLIKIREIFENNPALDWNAITPNGLSALWWALTPPANTPINEAVITLLLSLRREDGQRVINLGQMYAGYRPDYHIRRYIKKDENIKAIIHLLKIAQTEYDYSNSTIHEDSVSAELVQDTHSASHPFILRAGDQSLMRLYKTYGEDFNKEF